LKAAYERRLQIRDEFLDLMRAGYKRYKQVPPFDKGVKAETAGTIVRPAAAAAALSVVLPSSGAEAQWPRFRRPSGQGETSATGLPTTWDKSGRNILWQTKVHGLGNSSPVVWGKHIFLTSAEAKGAERFVHCYDLATGKLRWRQQVPA